VRSQLLDYEVSTNYKLCLAGLHAAKVGHAMDVDGMTKGRAGCVLEFMQWLKNTSLDPRYEGLAARYDAPARRAVFKSSNKSAPAFKELGRQVATVAYDKLCFNTCPDIKSVSSCSCSFITAVAQVATRHNCQLIVASIVVTCVGLRQTQLHSNCPLKC
jgi:hypothetical protein